MSSRQSRVDRAVERVMDLDGTVYGDERERAVFMEATTFGFTLGTFVTLGAAAATALTGAVLMPAVLLVVLAVPAWSTSWYANRCGVDLNDVIDRVGGRSKVPTMVAMFGGIVVTVAAMAYTVFTGQGLVVPPAVDVFGPDATGVAASLVRGAVIGGLGGTVIGLVALIVGSRLRARRPAAGSAADDVDED